MAVFVRRMPQTMILKTNVTAQNKKYFSGMVVVGSANNWS